MLAHKVHDNSVTVANLLRQTKGKLTKSCYTTGSHIAASSKIKNIDCKQVTWAKYDPPSASSCGGNIDPNLIHGSLDPTVHDPNSISIGSVMTSKHRHTDRPQHISNNRLHLMVCGLMIVRNIP